MWDILIISLWRFLEQREIFLKHCTKVSEPCVCSFRIKHLPLWGLTSHETLPLSIFISYETSCCEILRHMRYISLCIFTLYETHLVRFYVTRDTSHCGILIQMKHIPLWVLTSQEKNLVVAFHFTRKICICRSASQYSWQKYLSMGHSIITLALREGGVSIKMQVYATFLI